MHWRNLTPTNTDVAADHPTIALAVLVDPKVALITDDTIEGRRSMDEMKAMAVLLMAGTFIGTLCSQLLFVPAAELIALVARLVGILFG